MFERIKTEAFNKGFDAGKNEALEAVALWIMGRGYATGHGDTIEDLLSELVGQVERHSIANQQFTQEGK